MADRQKFRRYIFIFIYTAASLPGPEKKSQRIKEQQEEDWRRSLSGRTKLTMADAARSTGSLPVAKVQALAETCNNGVDE